MHDPPKSAAVDLKLEPVMTSCGIGKIPGIYGVRSFYKTVFLIPPPRMPQHIEEGFFHRRINLFQPPVISVRLPCQKDRFYKPVLHICFHGHPHIFGPVLLLVRKPLWKNSDVIKDAAAF